MNQLSEQYACRPENLILFHYGELDATKRLQVKQHLMECGACREELAQLRAMLGILPKKQLNISPEEIRSFTERVNQSLHPRLNPFFRPVLGWSFAAAAAAALLLLMLPPERVPQQPSPAVSLQTGSELNTMLEAEMLLNLELLQNLDLLQELEEKEVSG
jgi:anti-sigma factor RsiW